MGSAVSLPESGHAYSVGQVPRYPPVTGARAVPPLPSKSLTAEDAPASNGLSNESDPMSLSTAPTTAPADDRRKKRAAVARFVLAGVAVLGIGAAATSAAWTDDAWFKAEASTPTIQLQGSNDVMPRDWDDADTEPGAITIPSTAFANLEPGVARTYTVHLQNTSTVPLTVAAPTVTTAGDIFSGTKPAVVSAITAPGTLTASGGVAPVTVTVTPPATWNGDTAYQGKTGSVTLRFTGTTTP